MKKTRLMMKPIVFAVFAMVLSSCGGQTLGDYEVLRNEVEASGQAIPIGTYDEEEIIVSNNDRFSDEVRLYVAINYGGANTRALHRAISKMVHFIEDGEGSAQFGDLSFDYEASLNLEEGTASQISNIANATSTVSPETETFVEGFLSAAAESLKTFLATYRFAETRGEEWIVDKLEDLGYVLNTYDEESHNYLANQILQQTGLTVQVKNLYQGYINQTQRWVQVIVFKDEWQATQYFYKRWNVERDTEYNYHYRTQNVFMFTSSYETWLAVSSSATE